MIDPIEKAFEYKGKTFFLWTDYPLYVISQGSRMYTFSSIEDLENIADMVGQVLNYLKKE